MSKTAQKLHRKQRIERVRRWYKGFMSVQVCKECASKENLTLHHTDPSKKKDTVSTLSSRPISIRGLIREIAKCEILCESCHKKKHIKRSTMKIEEIGLQPKDTGEWGDVSKIRRLYIARRNIFLSKGTPVFDDKINRSFLVPEDLDIHTGDEITINYH